VRELPQSVSRSPVLRPSTRGVFRAHQTANNRSVRSSGLTFTSRQIQSSQSAREQLSQTAIIVGWVRA
jgi:hypothetical protein